MRLTPHFTRSEMACKCGCGYDTIDVQTMQILNDLRLHFGKPVIITSAARCLEYNRFVGSKDTSFHVIGKATDFYVKGVRLQDVYDYLIKEYPGRLGIGLYKRKGFIHVDSREKEARWNG